MAKNGFDTISPFPLWGEMRHYSVRSLRGDLLAALSVALMALPQAVAYAFVAELPTSAGIFAAIFGTIFTAAFGSSRRLISGPSNTVAILIQSGTSDILSSYYQGVGGAEREVLALQIVLQIVLLIGLFQIFGGLLKLGRITQFTSRSVLTGYSAGAALAIAVSQLFPFFGIKDRAGYYPLYQELWFFLNHLTMLHWTTLGLGVGCLALLIVFYRLSEKIPGPVIVFIAATLFVALFGLSPDEVKPFTSIAEGDSVDKVVLLKDFGPLYSDLPRFKVPPFEIRIFLKVVPLAFAITLLSVLEATGIGRLYASVKDPPYSDNQEVLGLGVSNFLSSFLGAMPSSASFSRTALNVAMGSKTRLAAIYSGGILFLFVVAFGFLVTLIPLTALSALMLFTAYSMVNPKNVLLCLRATRIDAFVVVVTFASILFFPLDVALYIGVILSVILYLKQVATPYLVEYTFNNIGKLRPMEIEDERPDPRICIVHAEGELFFGAAELFQMKLRLLAEDENIQGIILQMLNTRHIDASVCLALKQVHSFLKNTHRFLLLSGVTREVETILRDAGLFDLIGEECIFPANEQVPSQPTRKAYAFAKELLGD